MSDDAIVRQCEKCLTPHSARMGCERRIPDTPPLPYEEWPDSTLVREAARALAHAPFAGDRRDARARLMRIAANLRSAEAVPATPAPPPEPEARCATCQHTGGEHFCDPPHICDQCECEEFTLTEPDHEWPCEQADGGAEACADANCPAVAPVPEDREEATKTHPEPEARLRNTDAELVHHAGQIVDAMCKGDRWRMSIPVNRHDSDIVLTQLVNRFVALEEENKRLRAFAKDVADNYDHEEQTREHRKGYGGSCRVCSAEKALAHGHTEGPNG